MTTPTTADFVGLADIIYKRTNLTKGSSFQINDTTYQVVDVINDSSDGFYGAVLYDQISQALFVVDRGTDPKNWKDIATDIVMAGSDDNLQWQDASYLAQLASEDAVSLGANSVYTVGHSLGGTLAQMQAAINGWIGVTFNAYGAGEVLKGLGYTVDPYQPNITNYRTLFDLVSDSSTQIGSVVTLETSQDRSFLASAQITDPLGLVKTVGEDHGISNFYNDQNSDLTGSRHAGVPTYVAAGMFAFPAATDTAIYLAQNIVLGLGKVLASTREILADIYDTTSPVAVASADLSWIEGNYKPGKTVTIPADYYLLPNALNPSVANNVYRAALVAGSPVALQGIDPSEVQNDTLWSPGQTSGLTKDYLIARNAMVQAGIKMASKGAFAGDTITTNDADTYIYTDLKQSPDALYTLQGQGGDIHDIRFGDDKGDVLSSGAKYSELFGGAGDDMLSDGPGNSTLEGAAGNDQYWIDGTRAGTDHILDTDGRGDINWEFADGSSPILTGGDAVAGESMWRSADGKFLYTEFAAADGSTELQIHAGNKTVDVDGFTNGELGITLNGGTSPATGPGNLDNFAKTSYTGSTEYQDMSGTGGGDSMIGVSTTGGNYNLLEGEGNASYIYAGDGNNQAFADDSRDSPAGWVFTQPLSVVIQGGSGNQLLVGMGIGDGVGEGKETIIGGDMGQDTTAWTAIDGGGANVDALLAGGSQNSFILGGLGTDTIMAGSAAPGSGKPNPTTIGLAGLSFWAYYQQSALGGIHEVVTQEPEVSIPASADPVDFQIDIALDQLDVAGSVDPSGKLGTHYGTPFGLLGSIWDSGTDTSPWKNSSGDPVSLPGSLMVGGSGEDYLIGNSGNDTIIGGTPANPKAGVIDEVLVGSGGANVIYGGAGTELIFADMSAGGDADWADIDPADADTIYGGTGSELIYGSGGNDVIYGGSGNYTIYTGNGNAYVEVGSGNSIVNGGTGNDTIIAGSGTDSITAGNGDDSIYSGDGQSTINAGSGSDTFVAGTGVATYNAGTGSETYQIDAGAGDQFILDGSSAGSIDVTYTDGITSGDVTARNDGANNLVLTNDSTGGRVVVEGYFSGESNVSVNFGDGVTWGAAQVLQASMMPDDGDDLLVGSDGNDTITGGPGNDTIIGVKGDNVLTGGTGNTTIYGGTGNDTIIAGSGTDSITAGNGDDSIYSGDGNSTINAGSGSDTFVAGTGVATYNAGTGSETYQIDPGAGDQFILNGSSAGSIDVTYTDGITSDNVTARNDGANNLVLTNDSTGGRVVVEGYFNGESNVSVNFSDGVTLGASQILQASMTPDDGDDLLVGSDGNDTITGGPGNDTIIGVKGDNVLTGGTGNSTIYGGSGADTIAGGSGTNVLYGGAGTETYVFNIGNGSDTITENASTTGTDVLKFGSGIAASDVTFARVGNSNNLEIRFANDADSTIAIDNFLASVQNGHQVGSFVFADGTTLTAAQVATQAANTYVSDNGSDSIQGGSGNDTIYGGSGSDTLVGGPDDNLMVGGSGTESIVGGAGHNTLIGGSGHDTIVGGPNGDLIETGTGYGLIETGAGSDTIETMGGQDTFWASNGSDIYEFGIGSGQDSLGSYVASKTGSDTLKIAAGLTAQDLTFTRVGRVSEYDADEDDLVIGIKGTKDSFTIQDYFGYFGGTASEHLPIALSFQDGSTLTYNQIESLANQQSDWNGAINSITGVGKPGYDPNYTSTAVLTSDVFQRGDGALALDPSWNIPPPDVASGDSWDLALGQGIRPQDIELKAEGDSVLLNIKGTSDSLFIPGLLDASVEGYAFTGLRFSDGTAWSLPTVLSHVEYALGSTGTAINVINTGTVIAPTGPNDTINAIDGTTVDFGHGDGNTILNLSTGAGGESGPGDPNILVLGPGITPADVSVSGTFESGATPADVGGPDPESGNLVTFTLKDTGESLTVLDADDSGSQIDQVRFADGSSWDAFNIVSMAHVGAPVELSEANTPASALQGLPSGTPVLIGGLSNSTLQGGSGNTVIIPGDGIEAPPGTTPTFINTVEYGLDDGNTTIEGAWGGGPDPTVSTVLQFSSGITASDIVVSRTLDYDVYNAIDNGGPSTTFDSDGEGSGNLVLTIASTGKTITIPYFVYQSNSGGPLALTALPAVTFADGSTLNLSQYILGDMSDVVSSTFVAGVRGDETLTGVSGGGIGAAYGNTVNLGTGQTVYADGLDYFPPGSSPSPTDPPPQTTYVFNTTSSNDTVAPNYNSDLAFGPGISESDVELVTNVTTWFPGQSQQYNAYGKALIYIKSTGSFVFLVDQNVSEVSQTSGFTSEPMDSVSFANGDEYTWREFVSKFGQIEYTQSGLPYSDETSIGYGTLFTTASDGQTGYYATIPYVPGEALSGDLFIRGDVSNSGFVNAINTSFGFYHAMIFDASADDAKLLPASMQPSIVTATLQQPVTFNFTPGLGDDVIEDYDANGLIIKLPAGVSPSDVSLTEEQYGLPSISMTGNDVSLNITVKGTNGSTSTLTVNGFMNGSGDALTDKPLMIEFADGTTWNDSDIEQQAWQTVGNADGYYIYLGQNEPSTIDLTKSGVGTYYQSVIVANDGPNTIDLGHDNVDAANGVDTFVVDSNTNSIIDNFNPNQDVIQFSSDINPHDIQVQQGSAVWPDAAPGTYSYSFVLHGTGQTLLTVNSNEFDKSDEAGIVQFSNGVVWSLSDLVGTSAVAPTQEDSYDAAGTNGGLVVSQAIRGTAGNQSLAGGSGDDQIAAGVGDDTLNGAGGYDTLFAGQGNDTFVFGHGSGHDTIVPYGSGTFSNTLAFSSDVAPSDVSVVRPNSGNDLELVLNDSGETVLLPNFLAGSADQSVQQVSFSDGTTWNAATLVSKSHQGSGVAGYLTADTSNESITGGLGNDTLIGDANSDTLTAGSGDDLIENGNGSNLIVTGAGHDTIYGGAGSDQIIAGTGDALIYGGTGAETYQFGSSFGHDTIFADPGATGTDVIRFVDDIDPSIVSFSDTSDGGVLISLDANGDSILLPNHYADGVPVKDITQVVFGNGATATMANIDKQLSQSGGAPVHYTVPTGTVITAGPGNVKITSDNGNDTLVAGTGNDTLVGGSGTDELDAGPGNDLLMGGSGQETYVLGMGIGQDTVQANAGAASNVIQFGDGVAPSSLSLSATAGGDLVISIGGSDGSVSIEGFNLLNPPQSFPIRSFEFTDGTSLTLQQLLANHAVTGSVGSFTNADGSVTSYAFTPLSTQIYSARKVNSKGQLIDSVTLNANQPEIQEHYTYNADGSYTEVYVSTPAGGNAASATTTTYDYSASGIKTGEQVVGPNGTGVVYTFNAAGQVVAEHATWADGTVTDTTYNAQGQKLTVDATLKSGVTDDTTYTYNADGSYTEVYVVTPAGGDAASATTTTYDYGPSGIKTGEQVVGPNGTGVVYTFNAAGQVVAEHATWADGTVTDTTYNAQGQKLTVDATLKSGVTDDTTYTYNADGSYTEVYVVTPAGGDAASATTTTYDYSASGIKTGEQVVGPNGTGVIYTFNAAGQVVAEHATSADGTVTDTTFNAQGQKLTVDATSATGATTDSTYVYNADGSYTDTIVSTPAGGGASTTVVETYNAAGQRVDEQAKNVDDSTVASAYNTQGQTVTSATGAGRLTLSPVATSIETAAPHVMTREGSSVSPHTASGGTPSSSDVQPTIANNETVNRVSDLPSMTALKTGLGVPAGLDESLQQQPYPQEASPSYGAPADPMANDPNDPNAGSALAFSAGTDGAWLNGSVTTPMENDALTPLFGPRRAGTTRVADEMVKALTAQGALRSLHTGLDFGMTTPANQIRLQGGATWSVSTTDRTLASLANDHGGDSGAMAHAQLIGAMASFAPAASAESSSLVPFASDDFAIAVAAQTH